MIERDRQNSVTLHTATSKRWQIAPELSQSQYTPFRGMNRVLATILFQRGLTDHAAAMRFLAGETELADPFKMRGVNEAISRIRRAIRTGELIVVYGDFDADGVTSTALLVTALRAVGANVKQYIPHRVDEGYGLNFEALAKIAAFGAKLVITVDCGIRSIEEVEYGVDQCKLDMIVTDHHTVGADIPDRALAVINPKQPGCKYGEDMLAGVGIAYRLADALFRATKNSRGNVQPPFPVEDLLDLVAIGTVADLAPLDRLENRAMVNGGLRLMRENPRLGIKALLAVSGTDPSKVDAGTIGFRIGPRINAAGRLASASDAYKLLTATTEAEAALLAAELNTLNVRRQELTADMQAYAARLVGDPRSVPLIFAASAEFQPGIVGLVAGRLTEEFYRPAVIVHRGEIESHGSCRSIEGFNITEALDDCAELLIRHGGHAQAAGFTVHNDNLAAFHERLLAIAGERIHFGPGGIERTVKIDAEVHLGDLTLDLVEELKRLEPTGNSNPSPLLGTRGLTIRRRGTVGADGAHLKLWLADREREFEAIGFRMGALCDDLPEQVNVAYQLDLNEYNGQKRLQLVLQDVQPAS